MMHVHSMYHYDQGNFSYKEHGISPEEKQKQLGKGGDKKQ